MTATASYPPRAICAATAVISAGSTAVSTLPSLNPRALTSNTASRGISGASRPAVKSYELGIRARAISITSRWPLETTSATRAPFCWMIAFSAKVVP